MTRDVEGAKAFYGKIVGWRFEGMSMPDGTYWVCKDGETPVGGMMDISEARFAGVPVQWFAHLAVDDVDARSRRRRLRARSCCRIAIIMDPTGACLGWITLASQ